VRAGIRAAAIAAVVAMAVAPVVAAEDPAAEAKAALEPVLVEIVATARDEGASAEAKRALIEHELGIWIDFGHMSTVALGPQAERFSSRQLAEFAQEFERYLSDVYIRRIANFREKQVEIKQASLNAKTGVVTVRTLGGAPLGAYRDVHARWTAKARADVDYLLRRQRGDWRIIAIRIEGVDLARNFREQFQAVLERSDPDGLIAELRKRNAEREAQNPWEEKN
jgi:phospholipid transport system substrate-binding protein